MQKLDFLKTGLFFFLVAGLAAGVLAQKAEFNKPVSDSVQQNFKRANDLVRRENFIESLSELKKIIAVAPYFVPAHAKYIYIKAYFTEQYDNVRAEYENLMASNPDDPVYPAALAVGLSAETQQVRNRWFEQVVKLAPEDWAWSHYARGQLWQEEAPEKALAEFLKVIEEEPSEVQAYNQAIFIQERRLKNIDGAFLTAEKMARQPDLRGAALVNLWRLRLAKAKATEEAKTILRTELQQLAASSDEVDELAAARTAYSDLLKDKEAAQAVEKRILCIDSTWYAERGLTGTTVALLDGGPHSVVYAGRQLTIFNKSRQISSALDPAEQIVRLEQLLAANPNNELKQVIYSRLFALAQQNTNAPASIKYGEALLALSPKDSAIFTTMALLVAASQKNNLDKALDYARRAEELTKAFRLVKDIPQIKGMTALQDFYSEQKQTERYKARRAAALDVYGQILFQMKRYNEAEAKLRETVELGRSEKRLSKLSDVLRALNRIEEADRFALEAKNEYEASVRSKFKSEPSKDFELSTIDGRKVRLSDLKGKIVMVNFWATWCKPCVKEMPLFVKTYEKYKNRDFKILAVTVDEIEDRPKVVSFVSENKITFPVLYDESVSKLYGVTAYPTSFFIDRQGNIRYQNKGLNLEYGERELEIVIEELMKGR